MHHQKEHKKLDIRFPASILHKFLVQDKIPAFNVNSVNDKLSKRTNLFISYIRYSDK